MTAARRSSVTVLAVLLGTIVAVVACGPNQGTGAPTADASAATPTPTASVAPGSPSPTAPRPSTSLAIPSSPPGVTVDPGLLEVLPVAVEDVPLQPDPETAAEIGRDSLLAISALAIAVAIAAAAESGSDDLAVASVIRLRPDVFDEAFYQEWRDTYNEAACEVADGVADETATEIDGHATYVGTCTGGAMTYHTWLEDQGFIVSVTATGQRRFGELIIANLAELAG